MSSELNVKKLNMCKTVVSCLNGQDSGNELVVKLNPVLRNC